MAWTDYLLIAWAWLKIALIWLWGVAVAVYNWFMVAVMPYLRDFSFSKAWFSKVFVALLPYLMLLALLGFMFYCMKKSLRILKLHNIARQLAIEPQQGTKRKRTPVVEKSQREALLNMDWRDFELLVQDIFIAKGYKVKHQGGKGADGGIDLFLQKGTEKSIVQCKRYKGKVGVRVVREMFGLKTHHNFKEVYIYTSGWFTKEAYEFAKGKKIHLKNGNDIIQEMSKLIG